MKRGVHRFKPFVRFLYEKFGAGRIIGANRAAIFIRIERGGGGEGRRE